MYSVRPDVGPAMMPGLIANAGVMVVAAWPVELFVRSVQVPASHVRQRTRLGLARRSHSVSMPYQVLSASVGPEVRDAP